jgi:putative flippase GtrA
MPPRALEKALIVVRSSGVGTIATLVDLLILGALVSGAGVPARVASAPALAAGVGVQFLGNKLFAFRDRSPDWGRQFAQFILVEALGFVCNLLVFDLASSHLPLPYLLVRLLTTSAVYFGVCLPLWSRIFRPGALMESRS